MIEALLNVLYLIVGLVGGSYVSARYFCDGRKGPDEEVIGLHAPHALRFLPVQILGGIAIVVADFLAFLSRGWLRMNMPKDGGEDGVEVVGRASGFPGIDSPGVYRGDSDA